MKCKIHKVSRPDVEGGLRTNDVEGQTTRLPTMGKPFVMTAKPLNPNATLRYIETSPVKSVVESDDGKTYIIRTETGSVYEITILSSTTQ
jgi:hypothetical protein